MIRAVLLLAWCCASFSVLPAVAQTARVAVSEVGVSSDWLGRNIFSMELSEGVPFRVFLLDGPKRLVIDLRHVDAAGFSTDAVLSGQKLFRDVRMGRFTHDWTRFVADLADPLALENISMNIDAMTGSAELTMGLIKTSAETFSGIAGPPPGVAWENTRAKETPVPSDDRFVVVIDPGHGGVDPGAQRGGVTEKDLVLKLALKARERLRENGINDVFLTRDSDMFVALDARVDLAQAVNADLFISLHADALSEGMAEGATIYTLADEASDAATAQLAARHNRADILAGADLTGQEDSVTRVLLDMARRETQPRTDALARSIVTEMGDAGVPMNRHPLREAGFAVLKSADIPSVLLEVGFLSSPRDLANVQDAQWQRKTVEGLANAVVRWRRADEKRATLMR